MRFVLMLLPWLELFSLIKLGVETSALTALIYVLATLLLGVAVLQRQGRALMERLRQGHSGVVIGPQLLRDDVATGLAGLLLIVPGMITDVFALLVMIGPIRRRLVQAFQEPQVERYASRHEPSNDHPGQTIEGTFRRVDDEK